MGGSTNCTVCPAGDVCASNATVVPLACPPGFVCPKGSSSGTDVPCPAGFFSNRSGLYDVSQCDDCPPGYYCALAGQSHPADLCDAGYFCPLNAVTPTPPAGVCTPGHYCERGSSQPKPCPPGTRSAANQNTKLADCTDCSGGFECPHSGTVALTMPCPAGFYCAAGTITALLQCPVGHSCPTGRASPLPCVRATAA